MQGLDIIKEVAVSHQDGRAILQADASSFSEARNQLPGIMDTVDSLGFKVRPCAEDQQQ